MRLVRWLSTMVLLAGTGIVPAQAQTCASPVATVTVSGGTYALVNASPFEGRLYVYAPAIEASRSGVQPFQLWIVEGVYGRPFVRTAGSLSDADFSKLRASPNVRATAIRVARGDGSESTSLRLGKATYRIVVHGVSARGYGSANVQVCRDGKE